MVKGFVYINSTVSPLFENSVINSFLRFQI